jgi:hypothetical protein
MMMTVLGAVAGGLGANLMVGKEERRRDGERASVRGWMEDVKGERRKGLMGWKADGDVEEERRGREKGRNRER